MKPEFATSVATAAGRSENPNREAVLVLLLVTTSILTMLNSASFPALMPVLNAQWGLSNTEAGSISCVFYGGYICAVPFSVSLMFEHNARSASIPGIVGAGGNGNERREPIADDLPQFAEPKAK